MRGLVGLKVRGWLACSNAPKGATDVVGGFGAKLGVGSLGGAGITTLTPLPIPPLETPRCAAVVGRAGAALSGVAAPPLSLLDLALETLLAAADWGRFVDAPSLAALVKTAASFPSSDNGVSESFSLPGVIELRSEAELLDGW